jgi:hypothetical protein
VDQNGKLIPEGRICWSEAPLEVVIQKPYAIALLPRFVEVTDCWEKNVFFYSYYERGCESMFFIWPLLYRFALFDNLIR